MTYKRLYEDALFKLEHNKITLGEFEEMIKPLEREVEQEPTTKNDLAHNLCNSCTNIGCEFQSGIVRTKCAFYMPSQLEPDNCGNYVVQDSTTKNDLGVDCISREQAIKAMQDKAKELKNLDTINGLCGAVAILFELPSVYPKSDNHINGKENT